MPLRVLPGSAPLASLLFFSTFVVAQVTVQANCTLPSFDWTFNSVGQSPCLVVGYMFSTCWGGAYNIDPLPNGYAYVGPNNQQSNPCQCSTVGYSLLSACIECQGNFPFNWSYYSAGCLSTPPPSHFPNPVPAQIRVPHWAVLDVTNENNWNASKAFAAGDNPEYGPGTIIDGKDVSTSSAIASGVSTSSASESSSSTGTPSSISIMPGATGTPPKGNTSNAGAIAAGAMGGIATISIIFVAIFYLRRTRRRLQAASADLGSFPPMQNDEVVAQSPLGTPLTMRFYDPDDPTTFPGYQGGSPSQNISSASQEPLSSRIGSGSMAANLQTSLPYVRGYHGLPQPG